MIFSQFCWEKGFLEERKPSSKAINSRSEAARNKIFVLMKTRKVDLSSEPLCVDVGKVQHFLWARKKDQNSENGWHQQHRV